METLLPMFYIDSTGFKVDIAILSANPAKLKMWSMLTEDDTVINIFNKYKHDLKQPSALDNIVDDVTTSKFSICSRFSFHVVMVFWLIFQKVNLLRSYLNEP